MKSLPARFGCLMLMLLWLRSVSEMVAVLWPLPMKMGLGEDKSIPGERLRSCCGFVRRLRATASRGGFARRLWSCILYSGGASNHIPAFVPWQDVRLSATTSVLTRRKFFSTICCASVSFTLVNTELAPGTDDVALNSLHLPPGVARRASASLSINAMLFSCTSEIILFGFFWGATLLNKMLEVTFYSLGV